MSNSYQWRCQNVKKVTHLKGRLLDQAVIIFNCVPFRNRNCSQRDRILSFKSSSLYYGKLLYHIMWPPLNVTIFNTHVRNCVKEATPMVIPHGLSPCMSYMRGSRAGDRFLSNTGPDPLKITKLPADNGPLIVVFGSSLPHLLQKKERCKSWTPSDKISGSAHGVNYLHKA